MLHPQLCFHHPNHGILKLEPWGHLCENIPVKTSGNFSKIKCRCYWYVHVPTAKMSFDEIFYLTALQSRVYYVFFNYKNKNTLHPAVRSNILSKLILASCVWYSDRAYYWVCVLLKDMGRRLPLRLQYSLYQGQQGDVSQSVRGNYKNRFWWGQNLTAVYFFIYYIGQF